MKCLKPVLLSMLLATCGGANGADRPNMIIFLADDLGYADLGCQGCKDIPTPHIDSLAKNGVRFTDGYATHPVCAPSRSGLMTGMYQHRFGFEHNPGPERFAAPNFGLPRSVPTAVQRSSTFATTSRSSTILRPAIQRSSRNCSWPLPNGRKELNPRSGFGRTIAMPRSAASSSPNPNAQRAVPPLPATASTKPSRASTRTTTASSRATRRRIPRVSRRLMRITTAC